jgi:EAL domain-containing protein (putative c-di-GMP-specific phosphodiesterase class I)/GGDEF domain-containing protein
MSMYRQLWLAIITSTLLALGGSLFASMLSARGYLESQLSIKNSDNALALALSLSQSHPDPVSVELAVNALFDSGHYELIRVTDPLGKTLVERTAPLGDLEAPAWFARRLPIHAVPGAAQISNGWQQFGTVTLVSHNRYAYGALWKSACEMTLALALAGLIGGYLGSLVLRRLRRPLNAVIAQATAISERRFVTIDEPAVPELKQLAMAMNATVGRLKTMFEEEAARLETVRRTANFDPLTGLANRDYFMARLRELSRGEHAADGTLFIARLANLGSLNQSLGRDTADELLRRFAAALGEVGGSLPEALAARLNGADFALLAPNLVAAQATAQHLFDRLTQEGAAFLPERPTTWLAGGHFARGMEGGAMLAQVDAALAAVEAEGRDGLRMIDMRTVDDAPRSTGDWSRLIQRALDERWVKLVAFPVTGLDGRLLHRECPLRLRFDTDGDWQPAGRFLPMAERLKLTPRLDLAAVALGLDALEAAPELAGLAINLSASSIQRPEFRRALLALLHGRSGVERLWLEASETGALHHFAAFRTLCHELKQTGCRLGLEHFGRQFSQVGLLLDLGLDYLKVDSSFIRDLDRNAGNRTFLKGLSGIAHGIGLQVIAEGVASDAEFRALADVGFDGATGPAIKQAA